MSLYIKYHINKFILLSFIVLVNCQIHEPLKTHGIIYLENRSKKLTINQSNKNDVINIFGQPHVKNNQSQWIYFERILTKGKYHKLGQHILAENNVLILNFDKYGIINKSKFYSKDKMNKINFSEKKTLNELGQRSFVESFLQSIKQKMYRNRK